MLQTRVIPCLLLKGRGLVKTVKFRSPTYIGDPINAVKIFNDKEVDELVFLDIDATKLGTGPNFSLLKDITNECFMPLTYGGGVTDLKQIQQLLKIGFEKVVINTAAFTNPLFVREAVRIFGSSTIVISIDVKKNLWGDKRVYVRAATKSTNEDPLRYAKRMEDLGAGELLVNSVDADGRMQGYDLILIEKIARSISIPLVACGGAGNIEHLAQARRAGASGVSAGSIFVFKGPNRAVLISYPSISDLERILE